MVKFYTVMKVNKLNTVTRVDLTDKMLSKRNQTQNNKFSWFLLSRIFKWAKLIGGVNSQFSGNLKRRGEIVIGRRREWVFLVGW